MATEKRLIYLEDVRNALYDADAITMKGVAIINQFPTVDAVEVVHGRWEKEYDSNGVDRGWKCSHCKRSVYQMTFEPYEYCPHCGAKMDGDGNG
jgi:hypothetical protein